MVGFLIMLVVTWVLLAFAWMGIAMIIALVNTLFKNRLVRVLNWWMEWGDYIMFQKPLIKK